MDDPSLPQDRPTCVNELQQLLDGEIQKKIKDFLKEMFHGNEPRSVQHVQQKNQFQTQVGGANRSHLPNIAQSSADSAMLNMEQSKFDDDGISGLSNIRVAIPMHSTS